jgi:hypothetical protein
VDNRELETAIYSSNLDNIQRYESERILSGRERAADRRLVGRTYNAAAWALAFSIWTMQAARKLVRQGADTPKGPLHNWPPGFSPRLPANVPEYIVIAHGQNLAAIRTTTSGTLHVTEVSG